MEFMFRLSLCQSKYILALVCWHHAILSSDTALCFFLPIWLSYLSLPTQFIVYRYFQEGPSSLYLSLVESGLSMWVPCMLVHLKVLFSVKLNITIKLYVIELCVHSGGTGVPLPFAEDFILFLVIALLEIWWQLQMFPPENSTFSIWFQWFRNPGHPSGYPEGYPLEVTDTWSLGGSALTLSFCPVWPIFS